MSAAGDLRLHRVAEDVFLYRGYFSNSVVLHSGGGLVVVDTQVSHRAAGRMRETVRDLGGVQVVVNTHYHGDHTGGNGSFPQAEIMGTRACARFVVERDEERRQYADTFGLAYHEIPAAVPPTTTFEGAHTFTVGGARFELRQLGRAETPDACILHWPERGVVACGDGVATCDYPFLGVPFRDEGLRPDGEWLRFLGEIRRLRPRVLAPGHGPPIVGERRILARLDLLARLMDDLMTVTRQEMERGGETAEIVARAERRLRHYARRRDLVQYTVSQRFAILRCLNNLSPHRAGIGWWDDLRQSVLDEATVDEGAGLLAELDGRGRGAPRVVDFDGVARRARQLANKGRRPAALALARAYVGRWPGDARGLGLRSELLFDGARGVRPTVDATEYVAAGLREARAALAIDERETQALLTLGCAEVFGGMVLAQPMAPAIAKLDRALASTSLPPAQRRKGEFFLGKARQMEGDDAGADRHYRRALPAWARPLYPLVRRRMRSYP